MYCHRHTLLNLTANGANFTSARRYARAARLSSCGQFQTLEVFRSAPPIMDTLSRSPSPMVAALPLGSLKHWRLFSQRIPGLVLGCVGALLILQFVVLRGPHERVHRPTPAVKDLIWGDVNILHTTDTHGWYAGHLNQPQYHANWGDFVSFVSKLRSIAAANLQDLLVVDTGDRHDGNGLSDVTTPNGAKSLPIFIEQDYDLVTIGNHELYEEPNSRQEFEIVAKHYGDKYVASNVEYRLQNGTLVPFGSRYRYFEIPHTHTKVLALAFLFDFNRFNNHTNVTSIVELVQSAWFRSMLKAIPALAVDLLVVFGHIPVTHQWGELAVLHRVLRRHYPYTKIQYLGGHSHIRDFTVYDANATALQSGRFCETVGWVSVNVSDSRLDGTLSDIASAQQSFARSYIDFNLDSFLHHSRLQSINEFSTEKGRSLSERIKQTRHDLDLHRVIGYVNESNYYLDYVPLDSPKNIFRLLTQRVLPTLNATNPRLANETTLERIIIINTGLVRYDLYKGKYTLDLEFIVSPFRNDWVRARLPRHYATQIALKLNEWDYIVAMQRGIEPHSRQKGSLSWLQNIVSLIQQQQQAFSVQRLRKGYVTHDDFGTDGDDTPHRAVVNYPIPNVVESINLGDDDSALVDVVFYNFITPNIRWALEELGFPDQLKVDFYSNQYLGMLLNHYIQYYGA